MPTRRIKVIEAGHPVPDEAGLKGAEDSLQLAQTAGADDLLLVLLSGGGSANWIAPADGVSFAQKQQVTRALLRSGAPIGEVNTVRKHLSRIKGGRLARAGQRAEIVTLAISDVPHDDPSAIASGPTVPDPTTLADARAIVAKYDLKVDDAVAPRARRSQQRKLQARRCRICARAFRADRAAAGPRSMPRSSWPGTPATRSSISAPISKAKPATSPPITRGWRCRRAREGKRVAILSGGELTVTVRGNGRGGPNQEYALALAELLKDTPGISALAGRHRRRRRRRRQRRRSRRRDDRRTHVREDEIARPRSAGLSRQQRRHGILRRDRRSAADRPDADQCQRCQGDFGG